MVAVQQLRAGPSVHFEDKPLFPPKDPAVYLGLDNFFLSLDMSRTQIQQGNQRMVEEAMFYTICLLHSSQVLLPTGFLHHILQ